MQLINLFNGGLNKGAILLKIRRFLPRVTRVLRYISVFNTLGLFSIS